MYICTATNKLLSVLPPRRWYSLRAYLLLKT
nr:MAG TPA: hypothetical protein [Bacteriophage sp.]